MKTTVDAEIDLEDCDTWELAQALVAVAGGKEGALRCITRVEIKENSRYPYFHSTEEDHTREIKRLRSEVKDALDLIDRGRVEEGMHALRMFAAEEMTLTEWQRIKEGRHPFLKLVAA